LGDFQKFVGIVFAWLAAVRILSSWWHHEPTMNIPVLAVSWEVREFLAHRLAVPSPLRGEGQGEGEGEGEGGIDPRRLSQG